MDISLLVAIVLGIGALAFIAAPLLRHRTLARKLEEKRVLLTEKEAVLQLLADLDHDRETGKLEPADYESLREAAEARAIAVLKKLDATTKGPAAVDPEEWIRSERLRLRRQRG
ncbi:MAG: hypothetical protein GF328_14810 [Candidatus Latescibacteria bacterium]|nr:hypothetical protein [Candidatus Latescibacterota bacterium]